MAREVDLKSFLPGFVSEYREIKEILRAEDPEIQTMEDTANRARDCSFISHCGEDGAERFERMMNIIPTSSDTLEERRARILIRWNEAPPYTMAALEKKLSAVCGSGNFSIGGGLGEYRLDISVTLCRAGQVEELERLLRKIVPANLIVSVRNYFNASPDLVLYVGGAVRQSATFVIKGGEERVSG